MTQVLSVAGSLRAGSSNATLLAAASMLAPAGVTFTSFDALGEIPAFNPDVEQGSAPLPDAVIRWQSALASADAVLISSPEYAHGMPGMLKNALDWVVGSGELVGKPVGLLSASSTSRFAHPQLVEVLTTMCGSLVPGAVVMLDLPRRGSDAAELAADPVLAPMLRAAVGALVAAAGGARL